MAVEIIYQHTSGYALDKYIKDRNDYYILTPNNWNDYGYVTIFDVHMIKNNEIFTGMTRRILFDDQVDEKLVSSTRFDEYVKAHSFDLNDFKKSYQFISLGSDYKELKELFPNDYRHVLNILNDIIYLQEKDKTSPLLELVNSEGFHASLLRDQSSKKSLEEDKYFLFPEEYTKTKEVNTTIEPKPISVVVEPEVAKADIEHIIPSEDPTRYQFEFSFTLPQSERQYKYHFSFIDDALPKRINVLIGKNGSGKSQTLKVISDFLIQREKDMTKYNIKVKIGKNGELVENDSIPFIQNTIVIAYNPYENFTEYSPYIKDYSYLGFRRLQNFNENFNLKILSSIQDGLSIASYLYKNFDNELKKFALLRRYEAKFEVSELITKSIEENPTWDIVALKKIIEIYMVSVSDVVTDVKMPSKIVFDSFSHAYNIDYEWLKNDTRLEGNSRLNTMFKYILEAVPEIKYIALTSIDTEVAKKHSQIESRIFKYDKQKIILSENNSLVELPKLEFSEFKRKLLFLDSNNKEVPFSSGQEVFINLIIYLLSIIKKDSLVIIDEPENTLHPNYEVKYIEILYKILEEYKSFSIVATHSSIIVREVPKKFVHVIVIDEVDNQPDVQKPIVQTFGGNLSSINNYIFDDMFIENKPFSKRLKEIASGYETYSLFKDDYQDQLNYEMLTYIKQTWGQDG